MHIHLCGSVPRTCLVDWSKWDYLRPVFYAAVLLCTPEMMDVLAEVAKRALTPTSHGNTDESFWKEGICADGLGGDMTGRITPMVILHRV